MASATFSLELGQPVAFDCRIVPLPNIELVKDYFLWRQEDAHRNALNAHCYWMLRKEGESVEAATSLLEGKSVSYKKELLFSKGINFDKLPSWQKRGVGIYWDEFEKSGYNPIKNIEEKALRRDLKVDMNLELGEKYGRLIEKLLG